VLADIGTTDTGANDGTHVTVDTPLQTALL
jgi:hypothetical protein